MASLYHRSAPFRARMDPKTLHGNYIYFIGESRQLLAVTLAKSRKKNNGAVRPRRADADSRRSGSRY